jgi:hypothetical protein
VTGAAVGGRLLTGQVLRMPWASGDQTIWESPSFSEVGTTSSSITRQSIEYCGWLLIRWTFSSRARAAPAAICSPFHSLTPM